MMDVEQYIGFSDNDLAAMLKLDAPGDRLEMIQQLERAAHPDTWCGFCTYDGPALLARAEAAEADLRELRAQLAANGQGWRPSPPDEQGTYLVIDEWGIYAVDRWNGLGWMAGLTGKRTHYQTLPAPPQD